MTVLKRIVLGKNCPIRRPCIAMYNDLILKMITKDSDNDFCLSPDAQAQRHS
jgi:hypothetical protein